MKQPHILCSENDVNPFVLLPGDPMRVLRVVGFLDQEEEIKQWIKEQEIYN